MWCFIAETCSADNMLWLITFGESYIVAYSGVICQLNSRYFERNRSKVQSVQEDMSEECIYAKDDIKFLAKQFPEGQRRQSQTLRSRKLHSMPLVTIRMTVEFPNGSGPTFHQWLPGLDSLSVECDGVSARFFFTEQSSRFRIDSERAISKCNNIELSSVIAEATLEITEDLLSEIEIGETAIHGSQSEDYFRVGSSVYLCIVKAINRFISYIRAEKRQFWVEEIELDPKNMGQFFIASDAHITLSDGRIVRFSPSNTTYLVGSSPRQESLICSSDWSAIKDYMASRSRPLLVGSLLANAWELASKGHRRSSLLEAVVALEVALGTFANAASKAALHDPLSQRVEASGVKPLIEKVGLRGAFAVVLPILLDETQLPAATLVDCRAAIEERNSVVHQGQRDVIEERLLRYLRATDDCCMILAAATRDSVNIGSR